MLHHHFTLREEAHHFVHDLALARLELLIAHEFSVSVVQLRARTRGLARVAKARQVAIYLAHVALGVSLSALGHHFKRDRTTIAYACKTIEDARDDKAFDAQLNVLEDRLNGLIPASFPHRALMTAPLQKARRQMLGVLKLLVRGAAQLTQKDERLSLSSAGGPAMTFEKPLLKTLLRGGLVTQRGETVSISETGRALLARSLSAEAPHAAQHRETERRDMRDSQGAAQSVIANLHESPLAWLRTRRDKSGVAMISDTQFTAGEKLRGDFTRAQLQPKITASWDMSRAQTQSGFPPADHFSDGTLAAKSRVNAALKAVGPELSGVLLDVCCFLKGLSLVETERRWPPRAGKIVLSLALDRLAVHYGLVNAASGQQSGKMRSWGAEDYRPTISY